MKSHGFARPNLLGRMYLHLDSAGGAAQIYYVLDLADRLDAAALRHALAGLLDELPQLRSRVVRHWYGYRRTLMPLADVDLDAALTVSTDAGAADAFLQHQPNLARELPIQVLLHRRPTHDQMIVALHHSLADGQALVSMISRLGERYAGAVRGEPVSFVDARPDAEARYRHLLHSLPWTDRWRAFQQAFSYFWDSAQLPGSARPVALATFTDAPIPGLGRLRYERIGIGFDQAACLMRWAVKRNGSPTDVLLTAVIRAALRVWPEQAALPIAVNLPVSVRSAADVDITNRVAVMDFHVRAGDVETVFAQVAAATAQARTRRPATLNMLKFALVSYLPPALIAPLIRRYFAQTTNVRESLTFTALGLFEGGPQRFGPVAVPDSVLLGSVMAPPGLKIHVSPHGGRLNLCVAYLDAVITPASIEAFAGAVRTELRSLTDTPP